MLPTENNVGVRITRVIPGTPADRSDILVNDIVIKLDDIEISDQESLRDNIGQYSIGDVATLTVKRGKKEIKIRIILADEQNLNPQFDRSRQQNSMGSTLSKRRKDFPLAFQHDSMLDAKNCGGPIVDLDGRVVGINIARDGRVSSLALPRSIVEPIVERLKTGDFSPTVVNAEKLKKVDVQLKEIYAKLEELPGRKESLERKLSVADARTEELERMLEDIEARLKIIQEKTSGDRDELESVSDELKSIQSAKRRLEKQRKNLELGSQ
jgi:S1-C subfamily serine protease